MFDKILPTNFILACDSYKISHKDQIKAGTRKYHSNIVARKPCGDTAFIDEIVVLGPQVIAKILKKVKITDRMIREAEKEVTEQGYDFNRADWEYIRDLGYIPLQVRAIPEGTVVPVGVAIATIENTDDRSAWLVSYVETWVQDIIWTMSTIASKVRYLRKRAEKFALDTGCSVDIVEYMIHNFGDRGAGGQDRAIMAAIAHALFFSGSDTLRANRYIKKLYDVTKPVLSSVDANEHSTVCSQADCDNLDDYGAFLMSLETLKKAVNRARRGVGIPLISSLIDTFDDKRYIGFVLNHYKDICSIGGKYVCRPDSGHAEQKPIEVVTWLLDGLREKYGVEEVTSSGFRKLPDNIGVIQGDGLKLWNFDNVFALAKENGLAASNFVFGFGGGLTNGSTRDDFSFSIKATARMDEHGNWIAMQKKPKTDPGKQSLRGRVTTVCVNGKISSAPFGVSDGDMMVTIYSPTWYTYYTFDKVRARARA